MSELLDLAVSPAEVRGRVEEVYFSQNGFTAGCLRTEEGRRLRFAGPMLLSEQAPVLLRGRWEEHPKYGWQLRVESADLDLAIDPKGLANYLARHPALKGIGPKKARRLAERFGADFGRVLTEQPESVAQAVRVPLETVTRLREEWLRNQAVNAALTWLAGLGLTHRQVKALVDRYGNDAVAILKRDPYLIIKEVPGFGFRRADELARQLGIAKAHPSRLQAALLHCVRERVEQGDCWVEYEELIELATALLLLGRSDGRELVEGYLASLIEEEALACASYAGRFLVSLPSLRKMEEWLVEVFSRGGTPNTHFSHQPDLGALVDREAPDLNPGQRQAVLLALRHQTCLVTGAAGSGKTHVSAALARIYTKAKRKVALAAPTGKAAKRMEEMIGQEAFTLHRLLGYNGEEFKLNAQEPVDADLVLVDECFDYKQSVLTEAGWLSIGQIVNSRAALKVWSRNPKTGCLELKPILRWLRHPAPKSLLKITASRAQSRRSARILRCTPDHMILTPYGYRRAQDLRVGEEVIVRGPQLTREQRSILIGSVLGDGSLSSTGDRVSPQVVLVQGDDQRAYLEFKRRAFGNLAGRTERGRSGYGDKPVWRVALGVVDELYEIAREIVTTGQRPSGRRRWTPTNRFLEWIDEQALATWYLDNGSLQVYGLASGGNGRYAMLHSERFSWEDNRRLAAFLERRFGLRPKVKPDSRGHFLLRFSHEDTPRLLEIVRPFTPACMAYKVGGEADYKYEPDLQADTCVARVQVIERVRPSVPSVYDLEVADHHNYVAGNFVVSNCSMMDIPLAWHLFQAVNPKRTAVVLVGDHHQLPPVGPGNLLRDLVNLRLLPTAVLDEVVRQAGPLRENSMAVLQGEVRKTSAGGPGRPPPWIVIDHLTEAHDVQRAVLDLHQRGIAERLGFDLITQVQVLTPTHKGPLGTVALNIELQRLLQKKLYGVEVPEVKPGRRPPFLLHDKVIQKRNNYELGIMNGSQGKVVWVDPKTGDLAVRFFNGEEREVEMYAKEGHLDDLHLCYAQTIHSGQGSEYPCVVLIVHRSHSFQHHRNLLYTGVTRAQEVVILLGDGWGLRTCAQRIKADQRKTFLSLHGLRD